MTIQTESLGAGLGTLYEDGSGGFLEYTITADGYTSTHKLRVLPFDTVGTGLYTAAPAGTVSGIESEAENIMSLIADVYDTSAFGAVIRAYQTLSDETGVQPYPFSFGGAALFASGTAGTTPWPGFVLATIAGIGTDGSRWQMHLPGPDQSQFSVMGRFNYAGSGSAVQALMDYLTRVSNGPVHAQKTGVVTHSGVQLLAPLASLLSTSKRLRRRFRVS